MDDQPSEFIERVLSVVKANKSWLALPEMEETNLEFYWTEEGKAKYDQFFLPIHHEYLPDIQLQTIGYDALPGKVVYEDEHQVGIKANHDKSHLPNPYR